MKAAVAGAVKKAVGAALRHRRDIGDGDREEVENVAKWRSVEVPVRLNPAVGQNHRIVDGRRELDARDRVGMSDRVASGAVNLGGAAQRVGVLHTREARFLVCADDRRACECRAHVRRGLRLPRMGP